MANERRCIVDKKEYRYCPNCPEFNPRETWRFLYCCENCKEIYLTCEDFHEKRISAVDAYGRLMRLDLSEKDKFALPLQQDINEIFKGITKRNIVNELKNGETNKADQKPKKTTKKKVVSDDK